MSWKDAATQPNEPAIPDSSLLKQIAELRDRTALACLYRRHGATLHALAFGIVFDSGDAKRAVAQAMREAWHSARSFESSRSSVARWLAEVTRACALAVLAARSLRHRSEQPNE
jgi:DNA-directed RNA polymerase specialized sigma24 family protein